MLELDFRKLVSRADLVYDRPAARSEEGLPVGNGRMGSLVWTTPTELRFQINRNDVYANNCATNSFFERHNDYCGGCGYVDIDFGGAGRPLGPEPFPESGFRQRLSVYDGMLEIEGKNVSARVLAWPAQDVMAIAVDDRRPARQPIAIRLRMLRYETKYFGAQLETFARDHIVTVQNRNHTVASQLLASDGRIVLAQDFREGTYCCKSAVAIGVVGRPATARFLNETEAGLDAASGPGEFTILIASAKPYIAEVDRGVAVRKALEEARKGDVVVLAGKGHETYQVLKDGKIDFDDRDVARKVLAEMGYGK